jgi:glycosyltransferase involved in cell wall biosynthesis
MVLYTAAHGGFESRPVPLGGGAAIADLLMSEWSRTRPFEFRLLSPELMGAAAPSGENLVSFGERRYALFCREFERACTDEILRHDPRATIVLANDISEGPDFRRLAAAGYRIHTIYHVDVVAYVARIYARGLVSPERLTHWWPRLRRLLPQLPRLIFDKQRASIEYSRSVIVPSPGMKDTLLRCYPEIPPRRIEVLPWGAPPLAHAGPPPDLDLPPDACVLLTLSRISPEKGQDRLLRALLKWESRPDFPNVPLALLICGGPAYMMGQRYLEKLKDLAGRLRRVRILFPGHVTGTAKTAMFRRANIYVFPSRHESYGLTLQEAQSAGLPAVCFDSDGARAVLSEGAGLLVRTEEELISALGRLIGDAALRQSMAAEARRSAGSTPFAMAAARLAALLSEPGAAAAAPESH